MSHLAPLQIGQYLLEKTLGIGSFGKVKLATHTITGRKVAIKILNKLKIDELEMTEKVRREIAVLRKLDHPHIIKLYDVIDTPTDIFLVMEFVAGGELFDLIVQRGRLLEHEVRRMFQQIVSAIDYCHSMGIIHRDLKPENLLLDRNFNIKIADFGLSNVITEGNFLSTSCGSPNYAAPEVISGNLYGGPEIDAWSCGVILYALLCGTLPFDDEKIPTLFQKIKIGYYHIPNHLSSSSSNLISKLLTVDPAKRITIPEVQKTSWFTKNLPPYLKRDFYDSTRATREGEALSMVSTLFPEMNYNSILKSINSSESNITRVSYQIILDEIETTYIQQEIVDFCPFSPSDPTSPVEARPHPRASIRKGKEVAAPLSSLKWHLGIQSNRDSSIVMKDIFQVLLQLGFRYRIFARNETVLQNGDHQLIEIGVTLYKVKENGYLVDFQRLIGDNLSFLHTCATIIA